MTAFSNKTVALPSFDYAIAGGTYSASAGWNFRCTKSGRELAGKDRGYAFSDADVKPASVSRCYHILRKNIDKVEHDGTFNGVMQLSFTKENGSHVVVKFAV